MRYNFNVLGTRTQWNEEARLIENRKPLKMACAIANMIIFRSFFLSPRFEIISRSAADKLLQSGTVSDSWQQNRLKFLKLQLDRRRI